MQIITTVPANGDAHDEKQKILAESVQHLEQGLLIAMPTETVYGLAADATNGQAVASIFAAKQRPQFNPLIAHVDGIEMACEIGVLDDTSLKLANEFWPGPLTLIVPIKKGSRVHELVSAGLETIAIRCPGGLAREIITAFGRPLAAPSANRSGCISPTCAKHVVAEFDSTAMADEILLIDGGNCALGIESTIVQAMDDKIIVLRPGSISHNALATHLGVKVEDARSGADITAPGMLASHYAPRAGVVLDCQTPSDGTAILGFGDTLLPCDVNLSRSGNLAEAAANLYGSLRALDAMENDTICVAPIPNTGLGIAINDRLMRAAAPRHKKAD